MPRIAFIGAGNIATCLINGLIKQGHAPDRLCASNRDAGARTVLHNRHPGINVFADNTTAIAGCDIIVISVKPGDVRDVCHEIADTVADAAARNAPFLVISVAAGVPLSSLTAWLGNETAIVRCMPNTPVKVGQGMCALCAGEQVSDKQRELATKIFSSVGDVLWLDNDSLMDAATAVSGSGPAYLFRIMEALIRGAQEIGLSPEVAHKLVTQTMLGAAHLAAHDDNLAALREGVTSKGGTTESGLRALQDADIDAIFSRVLKKAHAKAREISTANKT